MGKNVIGDSGPPSSNRTAKVESKAEVTHVSTEGETNVVRIRNRQIKIPDRKPLAGYVGNRPPLRDEIVSGLARCGTVVAFSGTSKIGKTFGMIDLAESIATGTSFLDMFQTRKSSVLYFNLEVTEEEFVNRALDVAEAKGIELDDSVVFDIVHCRGLFSDSEAITDYVLLLHEKGFDYDAYIFDPVYIMNTGKNENESDGATIICQNFSLISQITNGTVFYVGHHPKTHHAEQANRISGSNVYGRHYDASIDISPLDISGDQELYLKDKYGKKVKPVSIEFDARSFEEIPPVKAVFNYPLFRIEDEDGILKNAAAKGSPLANLKQAKVNDVVNLDRLEKAFEALCEEGSDQVETKYLAEYLGVTERTVKSWLSKSQAYELIPHTKFAKRTGKKGDYAALPVLVKDAVWQETQDEYGRPKAEELSDKERKRTLEIDRQMISSGLSMKEGPLAVAMKSEVWKKIASDEKQRMTLIKAQAKYESEHGLI